MPSLRQLFKPVIGAFANLAGRLPKRDTPFSRIFDQTNLPLVIFSADGTILAVNESWRQFAKVDPSAVELLQTSYNVFSDSYFNALGLGQLIERAFLKGESVQSEPFLWNPDHVATDQRQWVHVGFRPLRDARGAVREIVARYIDVTSELEVSAEAQHAEMLRVVVDNCPAVVFVKDLEGRYLMVNDQWENAFSLKRENVIGRKDTEIFKADIAEQFIKGDRSVIEMGRPTKVEEIAPQIDGLHVYYSVKFPIRDATNKMRAIGGISTDITELKRVEAERATLIVRERTATEASAMKSIFLANMSHELRTPINGIMGMADLLRSGPLTTEQGNMTGHILQSSETLLTLVNDILDLSKAEAGKMEVELVNLDLDRTLADIEQTLRPTAEKKGLHLSFAVDSSLPRMLRSDPNRVRQVLINLVSNALKFTHEGGVGVRIFPGEPCAGQPMVRFQVTDTGIGLAEETLLKLFTSFTQADHSTTRKFGGSGLGLSISKHLVSLMGGNIGVQRRHEGGSQFWFDLPLVAAETMPAQALASEFGREISSQVMPALTILVAEDNPTNQIIATRMLQRLGHTTLVAASGREALIALEKQPFDLILMDCQMPDMDGYETARTIRKGTTSAPSQIPIIAITANAMRGDREKCLESGMTDYVSKPVRVVDIQKVIARVMMAHDDSA